MKIVEALEHVLDGYERFIEDFQPKENEIYETDQIAKDTVVILINIIKELKEIELKRNMSFSRALKIIRTVSEKNEFYSVKDVETSKFLLNDLIDALKFLKEDCEIL